MYIVLLLYVFAGLGALLTIMLKLSAAGENIAVLAGLAWMVIISVLFYFLSRYYFRPLYEFNFSENGFEKTNVKSGKSVNCSFSDIKKFIIKVTVNRGVRAERIKVEFYNKSNNFVVGEDSHSKITNQQYREFKQIFEESYNKWKTYEN